MRTRSLLICAGASVLPACGAIGEGAGLNWKHSLIIFAAIIVVSAIGGIIKRSGSKKG